MHDSPADRDMSLWVWCGVAVGAAILWLTYSDKATSSEIAALVAKGSFSCLYLINAFSTIIDTYEVGEQACAS